jgi:hypothetical protein
VARPVVELDVAAHRGGARRGEREAPVPHPQHAVHVRARVDAEAARPAERREPRGLEPWRTASGRWDMQGASAPPGPA